MKRSTDVRFAAALVALGVLVAAAGCGGRLALKAPNIAALGSPKTPARPAPAEEPRAAAREAKPAPRPRAAVPKKAAAAPVHPQPAAAPAPLPPPQPTAGTSGAYSVLETKQPIAPPSRLAPLRLAIQKAGAALDGREFVIALFLAICAVAGALLTRNRRSTPQS